MPVRPPRAACTLVLALVMVFVSCRTESPSTPTTAPGVHHWSYSGESGPERWGTLDEDYERCASGVEQSPVDLSRDLLSGAGSDVAFDYRESALHIVNNGHTVQVVYEPGSAIEVDGIRYELLQFHMHADSEHTVDGQRYPMELHLVHRDSAGKLAVVGLFWIEGNHNRALDPVLSNMPHDIGTEPVAIDGARVNAGEILPATRVMFDYPGSLTTPPCTEGVRWFVMTLPAELSSDQLAAFRELYPANSRPIQPLNDRDLRLSESADVEH